MMSMEEELAIHQFGQGVSPAADLLNQFNQLDSEQQRTRFIDLYLYVWDYEPVDTDIEQALTACSLTVPNAHYTYLHLNRVPTDVKGMLFMPDSRNPPDGKLDKSFEMLLYLFKAGYQRRFMLEAPNSSDWRYWDLSNSKIAKSIVARHLVLVDQIYNTVGFRSEFASIAKLWHEYALSEQTQSQHSVLDTPAHVGFLTYDEVVTKSVLPLNDNRMRLAGLLRHSLANALAKKYGLASDQAQRFVWEVVKRHLQEIYHTSFDK